MLDIIQDIDENGEPVQMDEIDYKIDKIKKGTSEMFSRLIAEKTANEARLKPLTAKYGYRLATKITAVIHQLGLKDTDHIISLNNDDIRGYFNAYSDLIAFYNEYFDFPANKQDFCALIGITVKVYNSWAEDDDDERRLLVQSIDDYFNSLGFHAGEVGNVNDKATMARMKIKDAGQGLVENNFSATISVENKLNQSPLELQKQLERLLGASMTAEQKKLKQ